MSCDSYFDVELQDQATIEEMFSKRGTARQLAAHMYAYLPKEENPVDDFLGNKMSQEKRTRMIKDLEELGYQGSWKNTEENADPFED